MALPREKLAQALVHADGVVEEIAELAAQLCGAAHAVITFSDGTRHRTLASTGAVDLAVLPGDTRFCCEVLHAGAPLEVSDAHFDLRYHDDPLVAGGPRIRFYSGVPLVGEDGTVVGTLSVLDPRAKVLEPHEREALWKLADVVMRLLGDMAARRAAEEDLTWQASHDTLTELANRRQFEAAMRRHIASAREQGQQHAVLYIDLDQFKVVNDTCGHAAGDTLLKQLARALAARMRQADTLARLGGDEFGILLEGCDPLHAQRVAAQVLSTIRAFRFAWDGRIFTLGASIGVAAITAASHDVENVLAAADTACYLAKDQGRNQVQVYNESDEAVSSRHGEMDWVSRITQCIEENRFFLHCQRVTSLHPGAPAQTEYLELLLRMRDEQGRTIPPMAFIPAAERYHLMGAIDRWVVERALRCLGTLAARRPGGAQPRFGVNVSGMSLDDPGFADFVLHHFDASKVPAQSVCFEITETAAISNLERAARFIRRFRALGSRFALDDFGTGLSSFAYLKALPVDYLKIDGSYIRGLASDPIDTAVTRAIQELARAVGARTIAESVENAETVERVRALGIDFAQGYQIHRPEPYALLAERMEYPSPGTCAIHAA
jgi:diguanylate cyclase (GGDEF)-like protein